MEPQSNKTNHNNKKQKDRVVPEYVRIYKHKTRSYRN